VTLVYTLLPWPQDLLAELKAKGIRAEISSGERLAKLVRNAELSKIPVMCVVGKKEAESGAVGVRTYADGDLGSMPIAEFKERLLAKVAAKKPF
jgi:threonyl-tRNA synthetase